ncbi:MAG: carbohydrate binding domain-containing protein [Armatimonadetes bacterium]|nr:carbohydrate binding domain-containing protein [Armatimonadota bacterium]
MTVGADPATEVAATIPNPPAWVSRIRVRAGGLRMVAAVSNRRVTAGQEGLRGTTMRATLCLLMAAAALAADPGELVTNGDFSARGAGRPLPDGWIAIGSDGGREEVTLEELPDGTRALRITALEPGKRWGPGIGQLGIGVKGGQWYRLRFRARSDRLRSGQVYAALRDVTNWPANLLWTQREVEPAWTDVAIEFQAARDLDGKNSRLQLNFDGGGTLLVAGISLVPIDPPPPPPPPNLVSRTRWLARSTPATPPRGGPRTGSI